MNDPSYVSFMQRMREWAADPEAFQAFIREENLRIDADVTDMIKRWWYGDE